MHVYLGLSKISGASTPAFLFPEEEITQQMFYISDFHAELKITQIYKFAYEKNEVLKERLNPWKEIKVIEDYTTNIPEKNSIADNTIFSCHKLTLRDFELKHAKICNSVSHYFNIIHSY